MHGIRPGDRQGLPPPPPIAAVAAGRVAAAVTAKVWSVPGGVWRGAGPWRSAAVIATALTRGLGNVGSPMGNRDVTFASRQTVGQTAGATWRAIAHRNAAISRAIAAITTGSFLPAALSRR